MKKRNIPEEYLVSVAIMQPDGSVHSRGFKEHWQLRAALGYVPSSKARFEDEEGFLTNKGEFVDRQRARQIGVKAEQCMKSDRDLISSQVDWWEPRP